MGGKDQRRSSSPLPPRAPADPNPSPVRVLLAPPSGQFLRPPPSRPPGGAEPCGDPSGTSQLCPLPRLSQWPLPTLHSEPQASLPTSSVPKSCPARLWKRHWPNQVGLQLVEPGSWCLLPARQRRALQSAAWSWAKQRGPGASGAVSPVPGPYSRGPAFLGACRAFSVPHSPPHSPLLEEPFLAPQD